MHNDKQHVVELLRQYTSQNPSNIHVCIPADRAVGVTVSGSPLFWPPECFSNQLELDTNEFYFMDFFYKGLVGHSLFVQHLGLKVNSQAVTVGCFQRNPHTNPWEHASAGQVTPSQEKNRNLSSRHGRTDTIYLIQIYIKSKSESEEVTCGTCSSLLVLM